MTILERPAFEKLAEASQESTALTEMLKLARDAVASDPLPLDRAQIVKLLQNFVEHAERVEAAVLTADRELVLHAVAVFERSFN